MENQWVVPYNPRIAPKYNSHINGEVCSTVSAFKYLYKYVYKGRADPLLKSAMAKSRCI